MKHFTSLFLSQSYKDSWEDYQRSLTNSSFACWDYIVLTASDEQQAEGYRAQLNKRISEGLLPTHTHFAAVADPEGKRVGSGGATLNVLRYISEHRKSCDFSNLRILVIHSGGDSKRVPQYSVLGKLFSPVPHKLPNGNSSTLFDEFVISMSSVPARIQEGMLLLSGDVLLLFNPLQIDFSGVGATAISFKEDVEVGKNHGVFVCDNNGRVSRFLHKQSVDSLRKYNAVNGQNCVDIDTGAVLFSKSLLDVLFGLISVNGKCSEEKFRKYVNDTVRVSLYGDLLYPMARESTLENYYQEQPEGEFSEELLKVRKELWTVLHTFSLSALRLSPAKFIHFGTTKELLHLMTDGIKEYTYLGWSNNTNSCVDEHCGGYNSAMTKDSVAGEHCYLEVSYLHNNAVIGNNVLLSYVDIDGLAIPSDVVLHGLALEGNRFVTRIYGIADNPKNILEKECTFLKTTLKYFMKLNNILADELWENEEHSLWKAKLYPVCKSSHEAVLAALNLHAMTSGEGDVEAWRNANRQSLFDTYQHADYNALVAWNEKMQELVCMEDIYKYLLSKRPASQLKGLIGRCLSGIQKEWLQMHLEKANIFEKIRLHHYVGMAMGDVDGTDEMRESFSCVRKELLKSTYCDCEAGSNIKIKKDSHTEKLPLRVNWGGGWSDTPPYCLECGGTVLNAAIKLNNKYPVEVTLTKIEDSMIIFKSYDMNVYGEFISIEELQCTGDPYDPYALQKAALLALGIIPQNGGNLTDILCKFGGGFIMQSEVTGVPKGSGLGTSSILAATCVKALCEFFGISYNQEKLYNYVLQIEQIMSTGGGWQDQVGGICPGIKYITSRPGIHQKIHVQQVFLNDEIQKELNQRFALIYTGQRRLARNILRDIVGRYIGNEKDMAFALNEIQRVATLMRFELERGNLDDFANLFNQHWELSKVIDAESTNTLIDQIFNSIEQFIDGKMICGAGGGGFLQVILKKGVSKEQVRCRLKEVFQDSSIDIWDCELLFSEETML